MGYKGGSGTWKERRRVQVKSDRRLSNFPKREGGDEGEESLNKRGDLRVISTVRKKNWTRKLERKNQEEKN